MKIEQLRKLLNNNIDYETIIKLVDIDEEIVDYILNEKNKYIRKDLVEVAYNIDILYERTLIDILYKRTLEEQLKIMKVIQKEKYDNIRHNLVEIACDRDILEKRTLEEQLKIMEVVQQEKDDNIRKYLVNIACDKAILEKRTLEEQLKIMENKSKEKANNSSQLLEYEYISTTEQLEQYLEILEKQNIKHFDSTKEVKDRNKVYIIKNNL